MRSVGGGGGGGGGVGGGGGGGGQVVSALYFKPEGPEWNSPHDCMVLHCIEPFIIKHP